MKYIVEFEDEPCMYEDEVHFYKCIQAPWWGLSEKVIKQLTPYQPDVPDTNVGNKISKFFDGIEEIFADIRERHGDDSVCGLCEYDGAYMGQSGDWCNECPGFDKDDCFKLSDKARERWTEEIINALPTVQPERKPGHWLINSDGYYPYCSECKSEPKSGDMTDFCPSCGADMSGGEME